MIPNTFSIPATADDYRVIHNDEQLLAILRSGVLNQQPHLVVGAGSNIVFTRHFPGIVLHLENKGMSLVRQTSDRVLVRAAAGEVWDAFVRHTVANGWYGAENLVAIPGTVGAAPVQNVGAYGVEAKDIIHTVVAYEIATGARREFTNAECAFAYRNSAFKNQLKDRYIVWEVVFDLATKFSPNLSYKALAERFLDTEALRPQQLLDAIAEIRWSKLPRPEVAGSAGSFFKNPVVTASHYESLLERYPDIVAYPSGDGFKLAAGWLIEHAGWKGKSLGSCGVYEKQALVLVNRGGCSGADVLRLAAAIEADVLDKFGVLLEKEAIIV